MTRRDVLRAAALSAVGVGAFPLVTGCGRQPRKSVATGLSTSPAARLVADRSARQPGARAVQAFGTDLFRAMALKDGNLVCSPYSVAVALGMRHVDYIRDSEAARQAINAWTSDQTQAKSPSCSRAAWSTQRLGSSW
jgi:hypothetical protein